MFKRSVLLNPEQVWFGDRVFGNMMLGPVARKFKSFSLQEEASIMRVYFDGGYVLEYYRQDEKEISCQPNEICAYCWEMNYTSGADKPPLTVKSGIFQTAFIAFGVQLAKAVMLNALMPIHIVGEAVKEGSDWLLTSDEIEAVYEKAGPFYLTLSEKMEHLGQVWERGPEGFRFSR